MATGHGGLRKLYLFDGDVVLRLEPDLDDLEWADDDRFRQAAAESGYREALNATISRTAAARTLSIRLRWSERLSGAEVEKEQGELKWSRGAHAQ